MNDVEGQSPPGHYPRAAATAGAPLDASESSASIPRATLTLQEGVEAGRTYTLHGGVTTLGRSPTNDIVLSDETVSRRHCRVYWAEDAYVLEDLNSSNGTYLNGEQIEAAFLREEDTFRIGDQVLRFTLLC